MKEFGGFSHNAHALKIITKLEKRYKEFDGLNLTFATLEGVLKHSYPYKKPFLEGLEGSQLGFPSTVNCIGSV